MTHVFLGGFKLQIDDICIAPAIIDLFYFIIFNVFSSTGHFYYVTIIAFHSSDIKIDIYMRS